MVRNARHRAAQSAPPGAAFGDRNDIRVAIEFLAWLDAQDLDLGARQPLAKVRAYCRAALASPPAHEPTGLPGQAPGAQEPLFDVGV